MSERAPIAVGDVVETRFSGRITIHRVADLRVGCNSQSGVMVRLKPPVPKSGGAQAWLDRDWFVVKRPRP